MRLLETRGVSADGVIQGGCRWRSHEGWAWAITSTCLQLLVAAQPFPHPALTKCPHVDHFGPEPVSAQTFTSSCLLNAVIPSGVPFPQ